MFFSARARHCRAIALQIFFGSTQSISVGPLAAWDRHPRSLRCRPNGHLQEAERPRCRPSPQRLLPTSESPFARSSCDGSISQSSGSRLCRFSSELHSYLATPARRSRLSSAWVLLHGASSASPSEMGLQRLPAVHRKGSAPKRQSNRRDILFIPSPPACNFLPEFTACDP